MIGFNHALVGGLIGKFLPLPIAVPLALASHFMLDALPHYGIPQKHRDRSKLWRTVFIADFIATLALIALPVVWHRYDILLCGFVAVIPDFIWVARFLRSRSFNMSGNVSRFARWHAGIQRYERPWGIYVELPLVAALFWLLVQE